MAASLAVPELLTRTHSATSISSGTTSYHSFSNTLDGPDEIEYLLCKITSATATRVRVDSGFAGMSLGDSPSAETGPIRHLHVPLASKPDTGKPYSPTADIILDPSPQTQHASKLSGTVTSPPTSTVTTKQTQTSSRRSSMAHSSSQTLQGKESRQSSKRSSTNLMFPPIPNTKPRPHMRSRTSSASYVSNTDDPYVCHQRAREIFQSLENNIGTRPATAVPRGYRESLTCGSDPSLPTLSPFPTLSHDPSPALAISINTAEARSQPLPVHTPSTIIDWTSPSTRRKEYEKIDQSRRGIRGLWNRVAPRCCRSNSGMSFFDGNDDDACSVRRYRMDLNEVEDENEKTKGGAGGRRPTLIRAKTSLSCFKMGIQGGRGKWK